MTSKKVNLDTVRARLADVEAPSEPKLPEKKGPGIRPETFLEAEQYARDAAALAAQERVDLGPLPEGAGSTDEDSDPTHYRGTPSDNRRVRLAIEDRCGEMDFADLILTGRVRQSVPVLPGKIELEFQSLTGAEDFWVESRAQQEANTEWGVRSWVVYARLTMSLVSMNGRKLPSHLGKDGTVDEKAFKLKMADIMKFGSKVLDIVVTNMGWFNTRVESIFQDDFESLGNG